MRTESLQEAVRSSEARRRRVPAQNGRAKGSLDALNHGEEGKARETSRGCITSSESTIYSGGGCRLRRTILAARGHGLEGRKGEIGEESAGFYRRGLDGI
jgi:hypothetical protein